MPNTGPDSVQVIALIAAFNNDGEMLLLKRSGDVHCGGLWSLPGGKLENGELPLQTAMREFAEETGLRGRHWQSLGQSSHAYADRRLDFLLFACHCPDPAGLCCESLHGWFACEALAGLPMPAANADFLPLISGAQVHGWLDSL